MRNFLCNKKGQQQMTYHYKLIEPGSFCIYFLMRIQYLEDEQFEEYAVKQLPGLEEQEIPSNLASCIQMIADKKRNDCKSKKRKNPLELKQLIKKTKVRILQQNFIRKLKRIIVFKTLPEQIIQKQQISQFGQGSFIQSLTKFLQKTQGICLKGTYQTLWSFANILQTAIILVILSLALAFPQTATFEFCTYIRIISCILYLLDMIMNFTTQRQELGRMKKNLKQIGQNYIRNEFFPDVISLFMFPFSLIIEMHNLNILLIIVVLFKLNNNLNKFERFEYLYITKSERQQYYGLLKVFILNFAIGHVLSILLNLMASINPDQNWYDKIDIKDQPWINKYIWGYYWGTNIMLSVGFGDVTATNQTQALILIFIETLSCITLAYNINYVGSIINQMKQDNEEKKKKLKYFHKMCKENQVNEQLQTKICNFIEESYQIKEAFQFDEYEQVLQSLPRNIHSQYIKQCNKHLFEVPFFNSLNKKTILNLAEAVCRRITHPDQIIKRKGEIADFTILQKGTIGLVCKRNKSTLSGTVIETFSISQKEKPKILSLDFIKRMPLKFDIKSLFYSVIYYLDYQKFMESLKSCEMDFGLFCVMKDKDNFIVGENQLYQCTVCVNQYHSRFQCPKYHYIPLVQHVIASHFKKIRSSKQPRNAIYKNRSYKDIRSLLYFRDNLQGYKKYLQEYCDQEDINEIANMRKYYNERSKKQRYQDLDTLTLQVTQSNNFEKQMNKIEELFVTHTNTNGMFWNVQCDCAYNFKYYFNQFNSINLMGTRIIPSKKTLKEKYLLFTQRILFSEK